MSKQDILIAEDDPVLREAYVRKFTHAGYAIRVAENGEAAVEMLRDRTPDLFICDIMMPERDGWWVLGQFPKGRRAFPVVMLTNLDDDETRKRCSALADGHFVKSKMALVTLLELARKLLAQAKPRRP